MPTLPVDASAEQHLLGSTWSGLTIHDPDARTVLWDVPPEAFFIADHRNLWAGMRSLVQAGKEPSELLLAWEAFGGKATPTQQTAVFEILGAGADLSLAPLKTRVLEMHGRRLAIQASLQVIQAAEDFASPVDEVTAKANAAFMSISKGINPEESRFWTATEMVETLSRGEGFRRGKASKKLCYFGIDWLDDLLLCTEGNVTILGGRPGAGKTGLALQARNKTAIHGIRAGLFSLEMNRPEVDARDAAWWLSDPNAGRIYAYKDMLQGNYDASRVMDSLRSSGVAGMENAISWHHPSGIALGKLAAFITEAVHVHGIELAVIDYFQYIGLNRQKGDSSASAFGANSMGIKRLAQELGIHILLLSQLNRDGDGGRPGLTDLKETSQLEQDASGVPMLYRNKDGELCLTLPKNRDGETVTERHLGITWPCLHFSGGSRETSSGVSGEGLFF